VLLCHDPFLSRLGGARDRSAHLGGCADLRGQSGMIKDTLKLIFAVWIIFGVLTITCEVVSWMISHPFNLVLLGFAIVGLWALS
jgi:hypothetical protein